MSRRRLPLATGLAALALGGAGAAMAQTAIPPPAKDFATTSAQADAYEIQAGRTAAAETKDQRVRAFAEEMVLDHTRTSEALAKAAAASGLPPPQPLMGADQARMLSALQSQAGPGFDRAYLEQQVLAHQGALVVEQSYASAGKDPNLRRAASDAVPMIRRHLEMAQQLKESLGGGD